MWVVIIWVCFESAKKKKRKNSKYWSFYAASNWLLDVRGKTEGEKTERHTAQNLQCSDSRTSLWNCLMQNKTKMYKMLPKNGFSGWRSYCSTGFTSQTDYERAQVLNGYILSMKSEHLQLVLNCGIFKGDISRKQTFSFYKPCPNIIPSSKTHLE